MIAPRTPSPLAPYGADAPVRRSPAFSGARQQLVVRDLVLGLFAYHCGERRDRGGRPRHRDVAGRGRPLRLRFGSTRILRELVRGGLLRRGRAIDDVVRGPADEQAAVGTVRAGHGCRRRASRSCTARQRGAARSCRARPRCRSSSPRDRWRPRGSGRGRSVPVLDASFEFTMSSIHWKSAMPVASSNVTFVARRVAPVAVVHERVARLREPVLERPRVGLEREPELAPPLCTIFWDVGLHLVERRRRLVRVEPGLLGRRPCCSRGSGSSR